MIGTLQQILERALERLVYTATTYVPPLLAALTIFLCSLAAAVLARRLLIRLTRAAGIDRFLVESGLSSMLGRSGQLRAANLVAGAVYWAILLVGLLTGLSAFDSALTTRVIETVIFSLPNLIIAGLIVLVGAWLAQFLGRSTLVWACNEGLPHARRLAAAVRILIVFVSVVAAADYLNFARHVFLAAFIIVVGGAVLAAAIGIGIGAQAAVQRRLSAPGTQEGEREKSLWNHL